MATYDVHLNPDGDGYLLDIQSPILSAYDTRIVVPLIPVERAPVRAKRLNPAFVIEGTSCSLVTQWLAAMPARSLGEEVASLADNSIEITDAVDFLLHGY